MGYKESNDQWTEHEDNFSALLESLSGETEKPEDIKFNSLEDKSLTSRARVHYHKFTRGKDLSRYSEKDLANIFGRRNLKLNKKSVPAEDEHQEKTEEKHSEISGSNFIFNGGSMKDYFKRKLPNFGKLNGYVIGSNGVIKTKGSESESEIPPKIGFGFNFENEDKSEIDKNKSTFVSYINQDINKIKADHVENVFSPKKKFKKQLIEEEACGVSNPAFNPLVTPIKLKKHILNTIEESSIEEHLEIDDKVSLTEINMSSLNNNSDCQSENFLKKEFSKKKKKKKRKIEEHEETDPKNVRMTDSFESSIEVNGNIENSNSFQISEVNMKKSNKNNKNICKGIKEKGVGIDNPFFEVNSENIREGESLFSVDNNSFEVKIKKKSKHRKNKSTGVEHVGINNPAFNDKKETGQTLESVESSEKSLERSTIVENNTKICKNPYEVKAKKRKMTSSQGNDGDNSGIINPMFDDDVDYSRKDEGKVRKKKKKLCDENEVENAFDYKNTGFEHQNDGIVTEMNENAYEVKRKKSKNKHKKQLVDINSDGSQEAVENISHTFDSNTSNPFLTPIDDIKIDEYDLMLNVVSEPIVVKPVRNENVGNGKKSHNGQRRKSVRFNDVTQEVIIPNNEELKRMENEEVESGIDNMNFNRIKTHLDENVGTISKTIDMYQAEIENDINENKQINLEDIMVGEMGNPEGENEKLPNGTKLKLKYANFETRTPMYQLNKTGAKKSYKHLIKGDIIVKFKNTNLHEIEGYAAVKKGKV